MTKTGPRPPMVWGLIGGAVGFVGLAGIGVQTAYALLLPSFLLISCGVGMAVPAMTTALLSTVEKTRAGVASGALNTIRQASGAIGVAVFGVIGGHSEQSMTGLHATFWIGALLLLTGAAMAADRDQDRAVVSQSRQEGLPARSKRGANGGWRHGNRRHVHLLRSQHRGSGRMIKDVRLLALGRFVSGAHRAQSEGSGLPGDHGGSRCRRSICAGLCRDQSAIGGAVAVRRRRAAADPVAGDPGISGGAPSGTGAVAGRRPRPGPGAVAGTVVRCRPPPADRPANPALSDRTAQGHRRPAQRLGQALVSRGPAAGRSQARRGSGHWPLLPRRHAFHRRPVPDQSGDGRDAASRSTSRTCRPSIASPTHVWRWMFFANAQPLRQPGAPASH